MQTTVPPELDGMTLRQALTALAPDVPAWAVRQALAARDVRLDGARASGGEIVRSGQQVRAYWPKAALLQEADHTAKPLDVVYEDARVLLVVKPQGLPSQQEDNPRAGDTALTRAIAHVTAEGGANRLRSALPPARRTDRRSAPVDQG